MYIRMAAVSIAPAEPLKTWKSMKNWGRTAARSLGGWVIGLYAALYQFQIDFADKPARDSFVWQGTTTHLHGVAVQRPRMRCFRRSILALTRTGHGAIGIALPTGLPRRAGLLRRCALRAPRNDGVGRRGAVGDGTQTLQGTVGGRTAIGRSHWVQYHHPI